MEYLLIGVHVIVCVVLIGVVLLQSGKAADLAGAFGGGGSQTALGSRGAATVLSKATTVCAVIFMLTSLGLALLGSRHGVSVLENVKLPSQSAPAPAPEGAPSAPAAPAPAGGAPEGTAAPAGGAPANGAPAAGAPAAPAPAAPSQPAPAGQAAPKAPAKPPG